MSALTFKNPSLEERVCTVRRKLLLILAVAEQINTDADNAAGDLVDGIGETVREAVDLLDPIRLHAPGNVTNWRLSGEDLP